MKILFHVCRFGCHSLLTALALVIPSTVRQTIADNNLQLGKLGK